MHYSISLLNYSACACRTLLARLCIVREDVDDAAESLGLVSLGSEYMNLIETTWRLLPEGNAAFLSNLMQTGNADKRYESYRVKLQSENFIYRVCMLNDDLSLLTHCIISRLTCISIIMLAAGVSILVQTRAGYLTI